MKALVWTLATLQPTSAGGMVAALQRALGPAVTASAQHLGSALAASTSAPCSTPFGHSHRGFAAPAGTKAAGKAKRAAAKGEVPSPAPEEDDSLVRVVLRHDVKGLGRRGDITYAVRGLVRHRLYPAGLVAYATPGNAQLYGLSAKQRAERDAREQRQQNEDVSKVIGALAKKSVIITRPSDPANPEAFRWGRAVHVSDILEATQRQLGIQLDRSHVLSNQPIEAYGSYHVPLNLRTADQEQVQLTVHVDRRGGAPMEPAAAGAGQG